MMKNEIRRCDVRHVREMNLHAGIAGSLGRAAGIGVDDGITPAGQDIDRVRGYGAWRHVERLEGDALNVAVQPVDGRKIEMIRIMREIGNGIEIAGARMRIAGGCENERVAAAAAR